MGSQLHFFLFLSPPFYNSFPKPFCKLFTGKVSSFKKLFLDEHLKSSKLSSWQIKGIFAPLSFPIVSKFDQEIQAQKQYLFSFCEISFFVCGRKLFWKYKWNFSENEFLQYKCIITNCALYTMLCIFVNIEHISLIHEF